MNVRTAKNGRCAHAQGAGAYRALLKEIVENDGATEVVGRRAGRPFGGLAAARAAERATETAAMAVTVAAVAAVAVAASWAASVAARAVVVVTSTAARATAAAMEAARAAMAMRCPADRWRSDHPRVAGLEKHCWCSLAAHRSWCWRATSSRPPTCREATATSPGRLLFRARAAWWSARASSRPKAAAGRTRSNTGAHGSVRVLLVDLETSAHQRAARGRWS